MLANIRYVKLICAMVALAAACDIAAAQSVPLPRPRPADEVRRDPIFVDLTNYIWDSLKKAMANHH